MTSLSLPSGAASFGSLGGAVADNAALVAALALKLDKAGTAAQSITVGTNSPTPATALQLINSTAATVGVQSASPEMIWEAFGWKTAATAASQSVKFKAFVLPVQGTTNPSGSLVFQSSINGAAPASIMTINQSGTLTLTASLIAPNGVQTSNTFFNINNGYITFGTDSYIQGAGSGAWSFNNINSSNSYYLVSAGAAATPIMQLGLNAASSQISQIIGACGARIGTDTNTTPTNTLTIAGPHCTGTGTGGDLQLAVYGTNGASGTAIGTRNTVLTIVASRKTVNISNIPTSSAGLSTGDVWSNLGILTIV